MVTSNLKNYKDEDIISVVGQIKDGSLECSVVDLKAILAEINSRHIEPQYASMITDILQHQVEARRAERTERILSKRMTEELNGAEETEEEYYEDEDYEYAEKERYPVLSFCIGAFKVLGWCLFVISLFIGVFVGVITSGGASFMTSAIFIISMLALAIVFLVAGYAFSESIQLKIDVEENTRYLRKDLEA